MDLDISVIQTVSLEMSVTSMNLQEAWQALDCQASVGFDTLICHPQHVLCIRFSQVLDALSWLMPMFWHRWLR